MQFTAKSMAIAASLALGFSAQAASNLEGRWAATLKSASGVEIPFRLDSSGDGDKVVGTLFNGPTPRRPRAARSRTARSS